MRAHYRAAGTEPILKVTHSSESTRTPSYCMNPNTASQYGVYQQISVQTSSPVELVVMLYRGAIRFTKAGIDAVERKDIAAAHQAFVRAQDVVSELSNTLDFERGGDISQRLRAIYTYVNQLLVQSNIKKTVEPAEHAISLLQDLLTAWEQINTTQISERGAVAHVA